MNHKSCLCSLHIFPIHLSFPITNLIHQSPCEPSASSKSHSSSHSHSSTQHNPHISLFSASPGGLKFPARKMKDITHSNSPGIVPENEIHSKELEWHCIFEVSEAISEQASLFSSGALSDNQTPTRKPDNRTTNITAVCVLMGKPCPMLDIYDNT